MDSDYIQDELAEIIANHEYEMSIVPQTTYIGGWANCFKGGLSKGSSNLRRTLLGIGMQMMQQLTGINFIFYFGTVFFQQLGTISNPFLISLITTLVNVCSTPVSFYIVEKLGRRTILLYGSIGMITMQFIVGIIGATAGKADRHNHSAVSAMIAFICLNISVFAMTWGPAAWIVIGEVFPLTIRSRGVGISTSSNWFWNCVSFPQSQLADLATSVLTHSFLDHRCHHSLPGRHGEARRQSRLQHLLHVGRSLLRFSPLRLLPCSRNQGSVPRTGRQDVGREQPTHLCQMEAPLHLRSRNASRREADRDSRGTRHRQGLRVLRRVMDSRMFGEGHVDRGIRLIWGMCYASGF